MILNGTAFFFFYFQKKRLLILHYCVAVFSRSSHKELKIANSLKNACKEVPFLLKWYTWSGIPATLLKTILCTYYLRIFLNAIFKVLEATSSSGFRWKAIYRLGYIIRLADTYGFFLFHGH